MKKTTTTEPTASVEDTSKPILKSKTILANAVMILSLLVPGVGMWVQANPEDTVVLAGAVNILLRFLTKDKIKLWDK